MARPDGNRGAQLTAGLYLVATPIGNARDITLRALDILATADVLAAEDTRVLRKLLEIHGIALNGRRLIAYHDHSGPDTRTRLMEAVASGQSVAYASDAGTPLVSDPGYALARIMLDADLPVTTAPGACAAIAGLTISGLPSDRFWMLGFIPHKGQSALWDEIRDVDTTLIFYENPKRVRGTLTAMAKNIGGTRECVITREITKRFEERLSGTLQELAASPALDGLRGECVILVGRPVGAVSDEGRVLSDLAEALEGHRVKDAVAMVAGAHGLPRRQVYQLALTLKDE